MATALTPHLSEEQLALALDAFRSALGPDAVIADDDELRAFRDPFAFATWDDYTASAALMPETVEEVQAIVRIANEHAVPLWTHATGMNNGYGGPAPRLNGSVLVSLRKMNRVLEINEDSAYAVVEPGVRWFDLYEALRAAGSRLMVSVPDLGWGSVVGNALENGATYLPTGSDMAAACGMEVVLPSGELLRTGMGAMPGSRAWHVYKRSLGPSLDTLFMQSNLGIVTRMGVWLMPMPECYMPLWLRVWRDDDLPVLVETLRTLMLDRTIENVPQIWNTIAFASVLSSRSTWYDGEEPIPDAAHRRDGARARGRPLDDALCPLRRRGGRRPPLPQGEGGLRANPGRRGVGREACARRVRRAREPARAGPGRGPGPRHQHDDRVVRRRGGRAHRLLARCAAHWPGRGRAARPDPGLVEREARLDYAAVLIPTNARSFIHVTMVIFDTKNEAEVRRAYDASRLLVRECATHGYGEYRAHLDFMDLAAEQYGFGDRAYMRFVETIKDAVDPNGILSPGKQGIWPRSFRETREGA